LCPEVSTEVMTVNTGSGSPRLAAERPDAFAQASASKLERGGSAGEGFEPRIRSVRIRRDPASGRRTGDTN
jgi:hypothetical protein